MPESLTLEMSFGQDLAESVTMSHYESQKLRDWYGFCRYLSDNAPQVPLENCNGYHVIEFLRSLDRFGRTKVHFQGCVFYGNPNPPAPCHCPLMQAWGSLDAIVGRLRAAYEERIGPNGVNPFASCVTKTFLRDVKKFQSQARGVSYAKKKKNGD